jgi:hypothetical protein
MNTRPLSLWRFNHALHLLSVALQLQRRPILREIISAWKLVIPDLIISGTGVSMLEVESVLGSAVAKEGYLSPTMTDVGGLIKSTDIVSLQLTSCVFSRPASRLPIEC